jgi:hypothetical protein
MTHLDEGGQVGKAVCWQQVRHALHMREDG